MLSQWYLANRKRLPVGHFHRPMPPQGYLAHRKRLPLGPYHRPMPSQGYLAHRKRLPVAPPPRTTTGPKIVLRQGPSRGVFLMSEVRMMGEKVGRTKSRGRAASSQGQVFCRQFTGIPRSHANVFPRTLRMAWGTSLTRKRHSIGTYSRVMPRAIWWP